MIVGPDFALGHIPKCGGDARAAWALALGDPDLSIDDPAWIDCRSKHRPLPPGKRYYALACRPLAEWTLSFLHEACAHAHSRAMWGLSRRPRPADAFRHAYADDNLRHVRGGQEITHWLRSGPSLFADFCRFLAEVHRPLTAAEIQRMQAAPVKPPRRYVRDLRRWWTPAEIERLYELNPEWAAVEARLFPPSRFPGA